MSSATPQASRHLEDFVELLRALDDAGLDFAVIGGCAVGAYARLRGTTVVSADLDIYVRDSTLAELLDWASTHGVTIDSRPQPRSVPVAVLRWRGEEINVLTASSGLPPPDAVLRTAREFEIADTLSVLIADPFDILANKLAIRREKDLPHIEILRAFIEDEIVLAFSEPGRARECLEPARRLMSALSSDTLPDGLVTKLVPLATDPVKRRFLAHRVPRRGDAERLSMAAESAEERAELEAIIARRTFEAAL